MATQAPRAMISSQLVRQHLPRPFISSSFASAAIRSKISRTGSARNSSSAGSAGSRPSTCTGRAWCPSAPTSCATADHPVERAAVAQLVGALGHHARPVHVLGREPALPALLELLADPFLEIL